MSIACCTMAFTFTNTSCPKPFLDLDDYPYTAGFERGRFCGSFRADLTCCLPCPLEYWSYSDDFTHNVHVAHWVNLPAMVCQIFLLLTFIVLPPEKSHRHYLSVGLCLALILLEVSSEDLWFADMGKGRTLIQGFGSWASLFLWPRNLTCAPTLLRHTICTRISRVDGRELCLSWVPWPASFGVCTVNF